MGKINDSTQKKEMGFFDHVEALRWHIMRSAIAVVALSHLLLLHRKSSFLIFCCLAQRALIFQPTDYFAG
jgi:hypothetical protein